MRNLVEKLSRTVSIAPLAFFRICFGLLMAFSLLRIYLNGWIERNYLDPAFHFSYSGLNFLQLPESLIYPAFILAFLGALGIAFGFLYRFSAVLFLIAFLGIELTDKAYYLNHYYFVSLMGFLLIFLPAHRNYSIDALIFPKIRIQKIPFLHIFILQAQVAVLYVFAGVAKLNPDWIFHAEPLSIWLPAYSDLPLVGPLLAWKPTAYIFSYFAIFYDLTIPFWLWSKRFKPIAFAAVITFHGFTALLFPIGLFPLIMGVTALIFLSPERIQNLLSPISMKSNNGRLPSAKHTWVGLYLLVQVLLPLRGYFQGGNLFWHEDAYRFGWRVMLTEKAGLTYFELEFPNGKRSIVEPEEYLNAFQIKEMSVQPDMILEFAHFLNQEFGGNTKVYARSYVSLNGDGSRLFIQPNLDLAALPLSTPNKNLVIPFKS